jgi:hypothetical protein
LRFGSFTDQTKDRILYAWLLMMAPTAIANITTSAKPDRSFIFARPRIVCSSNPKLTSRRLFTRSTAVRFAYLMAAQKLTLRFLCTTSDSVGF